MTPEQAIDAIVDGINRSHRERWQRTDHVMSDEHTEIDRLREVIADMLSFQNDDTECLANHYENCPDRRCRAHGCMVERVKGWRAAIAKATGEAP